MQPYKLHARRGGSVKSTPDRSSKIRAQTFIVKAMKCNSVLIENFLHGEASVRLPAASEGYFNFLFIYFFYTTIDGTSLRH